MDTGVLVAAVRGRVSLPDDADIAIPAIAVAEFLAGVHLGSDAGRQAAQKAFLDDVLAVVPVSEYDRSVAEHHAELLAHTARAGAARGAHDLIIAATARATDRVILTTDGRAKFDELPGVVARIA
nr:PIN domain-containing protein [Mycolicibacterium sphagni]